MRRSPHCLRLLGLVATLALAMSAAPDRRSPEYAALQKLPEEARARLHEVDRYLSQQPESRRNHLLGIMRQYRDWLEQLSPEERRAIEEAPSTAAKLTRIRELREQQWLASLPRAQREEIAAAAPDQRALVMARVRQDWQSWEEDWRRLDQEEPELLHAEEEEIYRWFRDELGKKLTTTELRRLNEAILRIRMEEGQATLLSLGRGAEAGLVGSLPATTSLPLYLKLCQRRIPRLAHLRTMIDYAHKHNVPLPVPLQKIPVPPPILNDKRMIELIQRWPVSEEREQFLARYMDVKQREQLRKEMFELVKQRYPDELRRLQGKRIPKSSG
jgi:hypothetical protein